MRLIVTFTTVLILCGCTSSRYPNWQYVRIEHAVPDKSCVYRVQEACGLANAQCYNWYKQRATVFGANTVVITQLDKAITSSSSAVVFQGSGGGSSETNTNLIALADYYHCPDVAAHATATTGD